MTRNVPHSYRKYQWPTDATTKKYVDRKTDRLSVRVDKLGVKKDVLRTELKELAEMVRQLFVLLDNNEEE